MCDSFPAAQLHSARPRARTRRFPGDDIPVVKGSALCALKGEKPDIGTNAILKLMAAVDSYIKVPERAVDKPFQMPIEDVFSIAGRGTVVTGRVEQGAGARAYIHACSLTCVLACMRARLHARTRARMCMHRRRLGMPEVPARMMLSATCGRVV